MNVLNRSALIGSAMVAALLSSGCGGASETPTTEGYDHFVAAATALESGNKETALSELNASIDDNPTAWAYFERARLYLEKGQEQDAVADCQKGLELDPQSHQLKWLSAELKKPAPKRFQGRLATPPAR
jgi:tetratricopeptide (TPR) repeat protein